MCTVGQAVAACEVVSRALDGTTGPSARTLRLKEMTETVRVISGVSHAQAVFDMCLCTAALLGAWMHPFATQGC